MLSVPLRIPRTTGYGSPTSRKTRTVAAERMRAITAFPRRNFRIIRSMSRRISPTVARCSSGKSSRVRRVSGSRSARMK